MSAYTEDAAVYDLDDLISKAKASADGFLWQALATSKNFTAALVTVDAAGNVEGNGPGDHIHDDHDTFDVILDGEAELDIAGEITHLKAGQALFIPAGVPHGFRGKGSMSLLSIYMPYLDPANPGRRPV